MLKSVVLGVVLSGSLALVAQSVPATELASQPSTTPPTAAANYGKLPLSFEANQGQSDAQVKFTSRGNGYTLFLTDKEAVLSLARQEGSKSVAQKATLQRPMPGKAPDKTSLKTDVVRMQLAGAKPGLKVSGEEQLPGTANYFIGNDPAKWHTSVPTYAKVKYAGVYPGVDLVYYGNQRQLEYDFVVAPGVDPRQVKLHFVGAKLSVNANGDLMVAGRNGEIAFHKPVVYQMKSGQVKSGQLKSSQPAGGSPSDRELVDGRFTLLADNTVTFGLGSYDKNRAVVIDPELVYSTYLGGSGTSHGVYKDGDVAAGIAVDASGNAYVTGSTFSTDFPVTGGAFQTVNKNAALQGIQAFVTKLNPSGTALVYSTYLGGSQTPPFGNYLGDKGYGIAVDASGHAYVTGAAISKDFPVTEGAFQTTSKAASVFNGNAFVTKLSFDGTALAYSTYLGGSGNDQGSGIAIDASGHAYVTGSAASTDFPTTEGAFQTVNKSSRNVFVTKLNVDGTGLHYSTYLGGKYIDTGYGIAVDASGHAYVTGSASSPDFPTTEGAIQTVNNAAFSGGQNGFVTKVNFDGTGLHYSTYLGGNVSDYATGIAVDASGHAYVTGAAFSTDFPTTEGAIQTVNNAAFRGGQNGFVTKVNFDGTALNYSTYLGGNVSDGSYSIAVNAAGRAYITGSAFSHDFPVTFEAFQKANKTPTGLDSSSNAFVTELNFEGTILQYSTYLGGSTRDGGTGIALDSSGNAYIAGTAFSADFPVTRDAFQTMSYGAANGRSNAFVTKFFFKP